MAQSLNNALEDIKELVDDMLENIKEVEGLNKKMRKQVNIILITVIIWFVLALSLLIIKFAQASCHYDCPTIAQIYPQPNDPPYRIPPPGVYPQPNDPPYRVPPPQDYPSPYYAPPYYAPYSNDPPYRVPPPVEHYHYQSPQPEQLLPPNERKQWE